MGCVSFREGNFILCFRRGPETKVCPKRPIAKVWLVKKLHTVDEKIPHHLGCIKPCNNGTNNLSTGDSRISSINSISM